MNFNVEPSAFTDTIFICIGKIDRKIATIGEKVFKQTQDLFLNKIQKRKYLLNSESKNRYST